jgi:2-amino-4-hydroxy-6-hydroxymethyldihydropteridine diphosphokinase
LAEIETLFGRIRGERNAARTLDLDLLDYHGIAQPGPPTLPHPRMAERAFVLVPLAEVAPDWRHPVLQLSVRELIGGLPRPDRSLRMLAAPDAFPCQRSPVERAAGPAG